jgi:hypothetical protein
MVALFRRCVECAAHNLLEVFRRHWIDVYLYIVDYDNRRPCYIIEFIKIIVDIKHGITMNPGALIVELACNIVRRVRSFMDGKVRLTTETINDKNVRGFKYLSISLRIYYIPHLLETANQMYIRLLNGSVSVDECNITKPAYNRLSYFGVVPGNARIYGRCFPRRL